MSKSHPEPMSITLPDGRVITEKFCVCGHSECDHYAMKKDPCARCLCNEFKAEEPKKP